MGTKTFERQNKKKLDKIKVRLLLNTYLLELRKYWGKSHFVKHLILLDRLRSIENKYLPWLIENHEKIGWFKASSRYEDAVLSEYGKDLRGRHKRKNFPRGTELLRLFKLVLNEIDPIKKRGIYNRADKILWLEEKLKVIPIEIIREWINNSSSINEIAYKILSHAYNIKPSTVRKEIFLAKKNN